MVILKKEKQNPLVSMVYAKICQRCRLRLNHHVLHKLKGTKIATSQNNQLVPIFYYYFRITCILIVLRWLTATFKSFARAQSGGFIGPPAGACSAGIRAQQYCNISTNPYCQTAPSLELFTCTCIWTINALMISRESNA